MSYPAEERAHANGAPMERPLEERGIFVGRMALDTERRDLMDRFSKYGHIERCEVKRGGYAFIEFAEHEAARASLVEDGQVLLGERIAVQFAKARRATPGSDACFRCGQPGHWSRDCQLREQDRGMGFARWKELPRRSRRGHSRSRSRSPGYRRSRRSPSPYHRRRYSRSRSYDRRRSRSPYARRSRSRSPYLRCGRSRSPYSRRHASRSRTPPPRSPRRGYSRSRSPPRRGRSPSPRSPPRSPHYADAARDRSRSPAPARRSLSPMH